MNLPRILLGAWWLAAGLAVIVAWCVLAFMTAFTFLVAFGSPPDTYTGQADDRHGAWVFLILLAVLSLVIVGTVAWPITRWRRRRAVALVAGSHSTAQR